VSWEIAWAEAGVARRFVQRLAQLSARDRRPVLPLILDSDPYLSAWINVEAALGSVPEADQGRLRELMAALDAELDHVDMLPSLRAAAGRTLRALLARRWLLTPESFTFVYEPFEKMIPLASLSE
jgi:hypothetical protein